MKSVSAIRAAKWRKESPGLARNCTKRWRKRNPDKVELRRKRYRLKKDMLLKPKAFANGSRWDNSEDLLVLSDKPAPEIALKIGRTARAVEARRRTLRVLQRETES